MKDEELNYYSILQVVENASNEVIKGAYKYLSQKYHPDKNPSNVEECNNIIKTIAEAYEILSNPISRKQYDEKLKRQRESTAATGDVETEKTTKKSQYDEIVRREREFTTASGDEGPAKTKKRNYMLPKMFSWLSTYRYYVFAILLYSFALLAPLLAWFFTDGFLETFAFVFWSLLIPVFIFGAIRYKPKKHYTTKKIISFKHLVLDLANTIVKRFNDKKHKAIDAAFKRGYSYRTNYGGNAADALEQIRNRAGYDHGGYDYKVFEDDAFIKGFEKASGDAFKLYKSYSVTCRKCKGKAYPVVGTGKNYECDCGNKFFGVVHPRYF